MFTDPTFSRRLLLSHGVGAALLLPMTVQAASRPARRHAILRPKAAPLIVLDPGHGGKDPGAIGISGTYEKHVAFAAAGELARLLRATGRYRVALTRENDVFIPLEDRVAMAQSRGAALFVSLHADAVTDSAIRGASVYTVAAEASDGQSAALARAHTSDWAVMPSVRHETGVASAYMQQHLVIALGHHTRLLDNPARHAPFAVLRSADIPSVLVEMGFMSNARDEAALREPSHRAIVVSAIGRAVEAYFSSRDHFVTAG